MDKQADNTIDFLKFVFAIFVVGIHAGIFDNEEVFISWFLKHWMFRIAVPFFFVTSGYYLGKKLWNASGNEVKEVFKNYRHRLIPPLLLWGGVGLAIQSIQLYRKNVSIFIICLQDIKSAIFYPQGAMWFLWACITASLVIQIFWQHKKLILLGIVAIVGYSFALICNTYYFVVEGTEVADIVDKYMHYCISARNGIFVGTLFVFEGILLSSDLVKLIIKKVSGWKWWVSFLVLELIFICEICGTYGKNVIDDSSLFIIFLLLIPLIVCLAIRYCMKVALPYRTLRNLSTSIYFMHRFILTVVFLFVSSKQVAFSIVLASAIVIGLIVKQIDKPFLNRFTM